MAFTNLFETDEQEAARLAENAEGSKEHTLSQLPVTLREDPAGLLVKLPTDAWGDHHLVVFVGGRQSRKSIIHNEEGLRERRDNFIATVVASDDPCYPAGGYSIVVPHSEIRRGTKVEMDPAQTVPATLVRQN